MQSLESQRLIRISIDISISFHVSQTSHDDERLTYTYQSLQTKYPHVDKHVQRRLTMEANPRRASDAISLTSEGPVMAAPMVGKHRKSKKVKKCCFEMFPIVKTLLQYQRSYIVSDLFSGLSVGFLHLPQSLAYALLASLPVSSGLYTSIFSILIYAIFGCSPHISMGTNSVVSLILNDMVERELKLEIDASNAGNGTARYQLDTDQHRGEFKLAVAMASTFLCGLILALMGLLRLGFLTNFMPASFIGGFTCAAGLHIFTSQVSKALNITLPLLEGRGKLFKTYIHVMKHIKEANVYDAIITAITVLFLLIFNIINPKLKAKTHAYVPSNLVVVIVGTGLSYIFSIHKKLGVAIVGNVPNGFPIPETIDLKLIPNILQESVAIAVITFSLNISMAMMMARMHHYTIDPNKELVAYGLCNLISAPWHCHISSNSPARTMILSNDNAKTVLHSVPSCLLLLVVIVEYGSLFEHLPVAVLAGIVMVAVSSLLSQIQQTPKLWRINKTDFVVWVITFIASIVLDLTFGLIIGVAVAMLGVLYHNFQARGCVMVKASHENVFLHGYREGTQNMGNIRIFSFPSPICYFNASEFKQQMFKQVFDPSRVKELKYEYEEDEDCLVLEDQQVRCVVIECSAITYIDNDGINMLKTVVLLYHTAGVQVLLARVLDKVYDTLDRGGFFDVLPRDCIFYELKDAIYEEWQTREGVSTLNFHNHNNFNLTISSTGAGGSNKRNGSSDSVCNVDRVQNHNNTKTATNNDNNNTTNENNSKNYYNYSE